tara:strand:+ start:80 stop:742 length:663 start_codon:yes stop_codon:yes gene_type:complete
MKSINSNAVLLVDDHPVALRGISQVIEGLESIKTIHKATSGKEAVSLIKNNKGQNENSPFYQLIISDINLPDYEILSLLEIYRKLSPKTPILIFSMASAKLHFESLINAKISGFVSKSSEPNEIEFAIKKILNGGSYFTSELVDKIIDINAQRKNWVKDLSEKENKILSLLLKGHTTTEIAKLLHLHKSSISIYKRKIFEKIKVKNSLEFFHWATKEELI